CLRNGEPQDGAQPLSAHPPQYLQESAMGIEQNKRLILDWVAAVNAGDDAAILAMTTQDFGFRVMARWPHWLAYRWNRQEFASTPRQMSTLLEKPIQMEVVNLTAEGDRVGAELKTD